MATVRAEEGNGYGSRIALLELGQRDTRSDLDKLDRTLGEGLRTITAQIAQVEQATRLQMEQNRENTRREIATLADRIQARERPDKQLWIGGFMALVAIGGILWAAIDKEAASVTGPIEIKLASIEAHIAANDARLATLSGWQGQVNDLLADNRAVDRQSLTDRTELRDDVKALKQDQGETSAQLRELRAFVQADSAEKEVQIDGVEQRVELERSYAERDLADLCREVRGRPCPVPPPVRLGLAHRKGAQDP